MIVQVTLTSGRLNCWSPSLSPVLFPVVATTGNASAVRRLKSSTPVSLFHFIGNIFWIFQSLQLCQWGSELSFWAFKHTLFPDPGNNKFLDQQWLLILLQNLVAVIDGILYSAFQNERIKLLIDNCSLVSDICSTFTFCFFIYLWALCCSVLTACAEAARYRCNEVTND